MEEIDALAATTATLVAGAAPGRGSGSADLRVWSGLATLVRLVQEVADTDPAVRVALEDVRSASEDPEKTRALAEALAGCAVDGSSLRSQLAELVEQATHDANVGALVTNIAGHARIGRIITVGHASTVNIHLPSLPPGTILDKLPPKRQAPLVSNLPVRNKNFTGRQWLLDQIHDSLYLHPNPATVRGHALYGLGGVGKSEVALEYAYRHESDYDIIWWVVGEQPAAVLGQLAVLARRLGIPEATAHSETVQALWDALRSRDRWLMVFDNVEDPTDLRSWWPPGEGHTLVTSRRPTWSGVVTTTAVSVLPREDSIAFLQRRLGAHNTTFGQLAEALGDLPLALEQAAAYIEETASSPEEYLVLLTSRSEELLKLGRPTNTDQTVFTTWSVALERIRAEAPLASDLLTLCAFLAPEKIPRSLLADNLAPLPKPLRKAGRDPLQLNRAIGALNRFSIISTDGDTIDVHRLVQFIVRRSLRSRQERHWAESAVSLMRANFEREANDPRNWVQATNLLPHALAASDNAEAAHVDALTIAGLLYNIGLFLDSRADYTQARAILERALRISETQHRRDIRVAAIIQALAGVLRQQGHFKDAQALYERALEVFVKHYGPEHPTPTIVLGNLACVLADQDDINGARRAFEHVLIIRERRLGHDHPGTIQARGYLATTLWAQDDFDEARQLHEQNIASLEKQKDVDQSTLAESFDNLAAVLHAQGDLAGSRTMHERALQVYETYFGVDHPETATCLHNLANVLRADNDLVDARALHERALRIYEERLGSEHPSTVNSRKSLEETIAELETREGSC